MDSRDYYVFLCLLTTTTDHLENSIELENNIDKAKRLPSDFWLELVTAIFCRKFSVGCFALSKSLDV